VRAARPSDPRVNRMTRELDDYAQQVQALLVKLAAEVQTCSSHGCVASILIPE